MGLGDGGGHRAGVHGDEHDGVHTSGDHRVHLLLLEGHVALGVGVFDGAGRAQLPDPLLQQGLSCVSQRAVVASGSSRPMRGPLAPAGSPPVSDPQAASTIAVETAVTTAAASRMQAFMCDTCRRGQ